MDSRDTAGGKRGRGASDIISVAKLAGVSPATVSRVTNGHASVDKKLARRVWKAIEHTGYIPNPQARALVLGRSRTLGLLISEITNPFFPELMQSFEDVAGASGYEVMVGSTNHNRARAPLFIRRLVQRRVEGVAVMTFRDEGPLLEELIRHNIPLVSIGVDCRSPASLVLEIDYEAGIDQAVQHLAFLGHRQIGFASGPMPHLTNVRRKEAFQKAVSRIGLSPAAAPVFIGEHTFEGGTKAAEYFLSLKRVPTALLCSNDLMAVGVLRILSERNIAVPRTMSVVGFDDIHLAEFANPPLSTVRLPREELAAAAFRALQQLHEPEAAIPAEPIRIQTRLVIRQSTSAPASAPDLPRMTKRQRVRTSNT